MFKFLRERKKDNKGFTLVELVIVVAILAILVGILAPQYTKYVEKSRKAADVSNMDEIVKAVQVYAVDKGAQTGGNTAISDFTITISDSGASISDTTVQTGVKEYLPNYDKIALKSKQWGKNPTVTMSIDAEGAVKVVKTEPEKFAKYSDGKITTTGSTGTNGGN